MKICRSCSETKSLDQYGPMPLAPDGLNYKCKPCLATYTKEWRHANFESRIFTQAKGRAKKAGEPFLLKKSDIVIPSHCPVLGIELRVGGTRGDCPNTPTLDRIDNSLGYIPGNVVVVSHRANRLKSDASIAELQALSRFYTAIPRTR